MNVNPDYNPAPEPTTAAVTSTSAELERSAAMVAALHPAIRWSAEQLASTPLPAGWTATMDHVGAIAVSRAGRFAALVALTGGQPAMVTAAGTGTTRRDITGLAEAVAVLEQQQQHR